MGIINLLPWYLTSNRLDHVALIGNDHYLLCLLIPIIITNYTYIITNKSLLSISHLQQLVIGCSCTFGSIIGSVVHPEVEWRRSWGNAATSNDCMWITKIFWETMLSTSNAASSSSSSAISNSSFPNSMFVQSRNPPRLPPLAAGEDVTRAV
jgi:hypothetical protein